MRRPAGIVRGAIPCATLAGHDRLPASPTAPEQGAQAEGISVPAILDRDSIHLPAMLERIQNDIITNDIVSNAILSRADAVLTVALPDVLELLYIVQSAAVVGIVRQDYLHGIDLSRDGGISFVHYFEIALEACRREQAKYFRHGEDSPGRSLPGFCLEPGKEGVEVLCELAQAVLNLPFSDLAFDLGIPGVEVVLIFVHIQNCGDRNTVLFEDELLLVVVDASDERAKIDACLCDREPIHQGLCLHWQK